MSIARVETTEEGAPVVHRFPRRQEPTDRAGGGGPPEGTRYRFVGCVIGTYLGAPQTLSLIHI